MVSKVKIAALVVVDALFVNVAYIFALLMRFDFSVSSSLFENWLSVYLECWLVITVIKVAIYALMGLYRTLWKYASADEMVKIVITCMIACSVCIAYVNLVQHTLPRSVYFIDGLLDVVFVGGIRFAYRWIRNLRSPGNFNIISRDSSNDIVPGIDRLKRIMLIGCGDAGAAMIKEVAMHKDQKQKVVVAIDDNKEKVGQRISGVKIAGSRDDIIALANKYAVDEIIIAIPSATKKQIAEIVDICHKTKCKIKIMPSLIDLINEKVSIKSLRDVDIDDLLGREPITVDLKEISSYLEDKIVLVTGAGGSIGSELCRQIAKFKPRRLVMFDIYENSVFDLQNEMVKKFPQLEIDVNIGSVRERARVEELFKKYKPHVIFHAAAHKHVPLMEANPREAIINNVLGTKNCIDMAEKYVADKFVLISTDKAVNPTSVMGATKRICEMLMQNKAAHSTSTRFTAVRFGNVLGSNGSVIPTFRRQIAEGGPVTVTHPEITRYFMTIPEAVQLVIQAGAMANGGEIFILDMGEPVKIMNLAENLIRLSGFVPYEDIDIVVTGLRPGEKLYEELLLSEEGINQTSHNKIFIGHPISITPAFTELLENDEKFEKTIYGMRNVS
ncbi:MAG: nucleoside-diphosphate sugar epimerase/dehydratase, partial [Bacillota bacterium]|nr:nucleoside-diphosphate sugar epimerase/dehydratase [Bacillota bacterium]